MTWKEIEEVLKNKPVVILPLGSTEEHGPHSITGDYLAAEELAKRVAIKTNSLYIPTVPFGNSEYFRGYPGTISLSEETVTNLLKDIIISLVEHGVEKIVILNGHAGNSPSIEKVARYMRRHEKIVISSMNLWGILTDKQKKEIYIEEKDPSGHGGEPLSSIMHYLFPDDMRMDLLPDTWHKNKQWNKFEIENISNIKINNSKGNLFLNMEDVSPEGILGNPVNASKERGEKIFSNIIEYGISLVENTKSSNMMIKDDKNEKE